MVLALRAVRETDDALIHRWYGAPDAFAYTFSGKPLDEQLSVFQEGVPGLRLLVNGEGRGVGLVAAERRMSGHAEVLWIRMLLVDETERRRGYAREALSRLFSICGVGTDIDRVLVSCDGRNLGGLAFWSAMGFKEHRILPAEANRSGHEVHILMKEASIR